MARTASRLALGGVLAAALAAQGAAQSATPQARAHRLAEHQLREQRQPLQPARSDHRAKCGDARAASGAFISSPRATRAVCGKTKRFRSSSATRCISRRRTAPSTRSTPRPARRSGSSSFPTTTSPSKRGLAYWPGDGSLPPSIIFGVTSGGLYSIKASDGTRNAFFGQNGVVDLKTPEVMQTGINVPYSLLSSATIYKNLIIIGAGTGEGAGGSNAGSGPAGDTRALDAQNRKDRVDLSHRAAARRVRLRDVGREQRQAPIGRERLGLHVARRGARHPLHAARRAEQRPRRHRSSRQQLVLLLGGRR